MTACILSIGDEILIGQITNTNAQWMAPRLNDAGITIKTTLTVGDDINDILWGLDLCEKNSDIIIITGGLGPTKDDKTKEAACKYFSTSLELNNNCLKDIIRLFRKSGKELTETNRSQAVIPKSCIPIRNKWGTAPGMWFEKKFSENNSKHFIFLPGVPFEMKQMMTESIISKLTTLRKKNTGEFIIIHKTLVTSGIGESFLSDKLEQFEKELPVNFKLAYLPSPSMVKLRLSVSGTDRINEQTNLRKQILKLKSIIKNYLIGSENDKPENALANILIQKNKTLACAESCTGGYLSHLLTSIPGSSSYFKGSVIAYSNEIKKKTLGIPEKILKKYGAVSEEAAVCMSKNIKQKFKTDFGIGITGIAGPSGGTLSKPVGTVFIACSIKNQTFCKKIQLNQDRLRNIEMSAIVAMNMLRGLVSNG
ncbi:MAG: hypothetical protein A3G23_13215 [Bacteroidetes bacterium RIFCSPLOWO2_12_FULL_37_12]|nr:MAG: hypothetical protein A3G23_13215 [Bacteroidetes bacterium RIFCSPLOWO2_12_FULL_37_12]